MSVEPTLRHLKLLKDEFQIVADYLNSRLIALPQYSNKEYDLNELISTHMQNSSTRVGSISKLLNHEFDSMDDKSDAQIRRIVRSFNNELKGLLDGYDEVRRLLPYDEDWEPWKLLVEIYYDTLSQFQHWFVDVIRTLEDPAAEAQKRGLADSPNPTVELILNLEAPKAMNDLALWLERESERISAASRASILKLW